LAGASLTTKGRLIPAVLVGVSAVLFLIYRNTFAVILLIVVILLAIALAEYSRRSPAPLAASIELADPRLITSANQQSFVALPSEVLHLDKGAVSIWAYLQDFGTGIRELKINRYLLAHATHENHPYQNVFSLRRGATKWDPPGEPQWQLWLADAKGGERTWGQPDTADLKPGWHHFLVRWNHRKPILELLIDGGSLIRASDYLKNWPTQFGQNIFVGCWPSRDAVFWAETRFWRVQLLGHFASAGWIDRERAIARPR